MKRKLTDLFGLALALTILSVFSVLILIASCGTAILPLLYLWVTGRIDYNSFK